MAKRFTDSRKWRDPFFRKLPIRLKIFWLYILDECNHAGFWKVDFEMASFCIGHEINSDEVLKVFDNRIHIVDKETWFIPKFIEFQYGELDSKNRVHASIQRILIKEGLLTALKRPVLGCKDKDKDKDKDKVKDKDPELKEIFDHWDKAYKNTTKERYLFKGGKEGSLFKSAKKVYGKAKVFSLIDYFFKEADENEDCWWKDKLDIGVWHSQINKMVTKITRGV